MCIALPGCHSQCDSFEEALENIKDAITTYLRMIAEETKDVTVYQVEVPAWGIKKEAWDYQAPYK